MKAINAWRAFRRSPCRQGDEHGGERVDIWHLHGVKGGTRARELMSGRIKVGLSEGRIGARHGAVQQIGRENAGWARIT